jgi:hypothetical protein
VNAKGIERMVINGEHSAWTGWSGSLPAQSLSGNTSRQQWMGRQVSRPLMRPPDGFPERRDMDPAQSEDILYPFD